MKEEVQKYYGETLKSSGDLQTNACCTLSPPPAYLQRVLNQIHPDVCARYYGCGLIVPDNIRGLNILDLGCGAGQDAYMLSALVGESGNVVGVDMTPAQLDWASQFLPYHQQKFNHSRQNVKFLLGELEHLDQLDLPDNHFDVIVSNCVINLCSDKHAVLKQAHRLLKPGGELYFSDVYADRKVPASLRNDPVLFGECLSGAYYWNDFLHDAKSAGFYDPRLVSDKPITVANTQLQEKLGPLRFYSATYRLFKIEKLEPACEDYGQAVIYRGSIAHNPTQFALDKHHVIEKGKVFPVCGNTYRMLNETRFAPHFDFIGTWNNHFGIFVGCGTSMPFTQDASATAAQCC